MALRLAFMGTPDFSVPALEALVAAGHDIAAVYCQPPRPAGRRGLDVTHSAVQRAAERLGLAVHTPSTLRTMEEQARFRALSLDAAAVVAYGLLLPENVLNAPRLGCFNAHASLLPRWRGAAPVQRAIMAGDRQTGVMIMKMDAGLDTGPVALVHKAAIGQDMTAGALQEHLSQAGAQLMVKAMAALEQGRLVLTPQAGEGITYAHKITKAETRIDWDNPAMQVHRHICGLAPFPGAWCEMEIAGRRERVKILGTHLSDWCGPMPGHFDPATLAVSCRGGSVVLTRVQKAGGKPLEARAFMRGAAITAVF